MNLFLCMLFFSEVSCKVESSFEDMEMMDSFYPEVHINLPGEWSSYRDRFDVLTADTVTQEDLPFLKDLIYEACNKFDDDWYESYFELLLSNRSFEDVQKVIALCVVLGYQIDFTLFISQRLRSTVVPERVKEHYFQVAGDVEEYQRKREEELN